MNCREVRAKMSELLDAEVAAEVMNELKGHLHDCEDCRIQVNTLKRTIELYKRMPSQNVPGAVEERLFKILKLDHIGGGPLKK